MSNTTTSNNLIDLKDILFIWRLIKKNVAILVVVPVLAYLIGYVYTYRMTDVYGARMQLLLKSDQTYDYQDPIYKGLGAYGMYMDVRNQIRILESRDLISKVVEKLDVDVSYFIVGRIKKSEVFGTYPFEVDPIVYNPEVYNVPIAVIISDAEGYEISFQLQNITKTYQGKFGEFLNTENFGITISKSYDFQEENLPLLNESEYEIVLRPQDFMINFFQSRLTIENLEHTSILEVNLIDDIASRGKMFLDTLAHVFVDYSKQTQLEVNKNTLDNIEKQIDEVQKMLVSIEGELLKYRDDNDIVNLSEEEKNYLEEYFRYSQIDRDLRTKLNSTELLKNYINQSEDEHFLPPSFFILEGDIYLSTKVNEYYTLQLKIGDKKHNVSVDHPDIRKMESDLIVIKKDVLTYLKNLRSAIEMQIAENNKSISRFKRNVQMIPVSMQGVENIKRELEINNQMYLFLLEKRTNTLITRAGIIPQVQIIETASSLGLIGPKRGKIRNIFALGGVVFALFIAFIRHLFFERINTVSELEEFTNLNIIGGIPEVKDLEDAIIVDKRPKDQVTECFRVIRSNIEFMGGGEQEKIVLVSSFFPGEGKTFCSTNMAMILARSDKKVLLVDFDLHKPRVHKAFGMQNDKGISNYLIDNKSFEEIINKDFHPNLDIITSGPIPPNPSELLLRKKMIEFVNKVKQEYDTVIFDSPPFGLLNDSMELSTHANVFVVVINSRYARKRGVQHVEKMLNKQTSISTGLVLNGIRQSKLSYYYNKYAYKYSYRYSYSSGYGYGYGFGESYGDDEQEKTN